MNICKQTFHISHVRISQKVKVFKCEILNILLLYEDQDIGRFSNLHLCTFKNDEQIFRNNLFPKINNILVKTWLTPPYSSKWW